MQDKTYYPYTITYRDADYQLRDFCCYATDAMSARYEAAECIADVHDRPNCVLRIQKEKVDFNW